MTFTSASRNLSSTIGRAGLPMHALDGVRRRRVIALAADFVVVSIVATLLWMALLVLTFGLFLALLPPLFPFVAFFYNGTAVSGRRMATPGMRAFDLQLRALDGGRPSFVAAALHGVMLYLSWLFLPVFLVSLVAPDKRCLHDMLAGLIAVRRPD